MKNDSLNLTSNRRVNHIGSVLLTYHKFWIIPVIVGIVLSAVYAVFLRSETWTARQSLIVRDHLLGQSFKPGRFDSLDSLKSAQETILEIARKPQVIRNTLQQLGPEPAGLFSRTAASEIWPSEKVIESVQGAVSLSAPNGAEFGRTEVIVLNAKASTRERSREFIRILLNEVIAKTNEVRAVRIQSMAAELTLARDAALTALEQSKEKLRKMDRQLGSDVDAMNALNDEQGRENPLNRDMSQIRMEERVVQSEIETAKSVLEILVAARNNPQTLVNISNDLIRHQPALEYLKKELVTAQATLSKNKGLYTDFHPRVKSGVVEVKEIQLCMFNELDNSIEGMHNDVAVLEQRAQRLNQEIEKLDARLINLGENRADFLILKSEVNQRNEIVNQADRELAEVRGLVSSADANLLTPVDEPQVATRPDVMGKKATVLAGALGGLMFGLGLVMLVAPPLDPADSAHHSAEPSNDAIQPTPVQEAVATKSTPQPDGVPDLTMAGFSQQHREHLQERAIQVVPVHRVPAERSPVTNARVPSVTVPGVSVPPAEQKQSETPLQPIARNKPLGGVPKEVVSSAKKEKDSAIECPAVSGSGPAPSPPSPATIADRAARPESLVDQAFELPLDDATSLPSHPAIIRDAKVIDLEKPSPTQPVMDRSTNNKKKPKPNRGRRAIIVKRTQPSTEMHRRQPNVRPVNLIKSVGPDIQDSTGSVAPESDSSESQKPISDAPPESLSDSNAALGLKEDPLLADRLSSGSLEENRLVTEAEKKDQMDLPVSEQIKRLTETIASFAGPIAKPDSEDHGNTSL